MGALVTAALTAIIKFLFDVVLTPAEWALEMETAAGGLHYLWGVPWAQGLIAVLQVVAGALLALRATVDALQTATLRSEGAPTDPGGLVKRIVLSAIAIVAGPRLAYQMLLAGNDLANLVAHLGLATSLPTSVTNAAGVGAQLALSAIFSLIVVLIGLVLIVVCLAQGLVRSVEMLLAALVSPLLALGFMSENGGTAAAWFVETLVLACTQGVQILLLYVGVTFLVAPGAAGTLGNALLRPFFFLAACWVAVKTPHILRQYIYHSGAGSTAAGMVGRAVLSKLPF